MEESGPQYVDFTVVTEVRTTPDRYAKFLSLLRDIAVEPVKMNVLDASGNRLLFELPEDKFDPSVVTVDELHYFQKRFSLDNTPNSLSTSTYNKLISGIDDEAKTVDESGQLRVEALAFAERCRRVDRGEDTDITGPKTLALVRGYLDFFETSRPQTPNTEQG